MRLGIFTPVEKLLYHAEKVSQFVQGKHIYPIMVEWFLSGCCNLKCDFCSFSKVQENSFFDTDKAYKVIDSLSKCDVKAINMTGGGEPTLHKDYTKITQYAFSKGIEVGLFTNGARMHIDKMKSILKTHRWVRFSIDAGTKETFLKIKGRDKFEETMNNLRFLMMIKSNFASQTDVGAGFVITPRNYTEIETFADQCLHLGVDYVQFKPQIHPYFDGGQEDKEFWTTKVRPLLEKVSKDKRVMVNLYKFQDLEDVRERQYSTCYGWKFCPCIASDGCLYICNYLAYMPEHSLGSLYDNSFEKLWKDKEIKVCDKCQMLCKNDAINKVLFKIKECRNGHHNFL